MTPEDQAALDEAQARLDARREEWAEWAGWTPEEPAPPAPKIRKDHPSLQETCFDCERVGTWAPWKVGDDTVMLCPKCEGKRRDDERRGLKLETLLGANRIPPAFWRFSEEWLLRNEGGWPRDARGHSAETWDGEPPLVTLAGSVGNGKSTLAVHLAVRCWRRHFFREIGSIAWVTPADLLREFYADSRPKTLRAELAPVTILDEAFGPVVNSDHAFGVQDDFISRRWDSRGRRVTILTTNLRAARGDGTEPSIEEMSTRVFDRLTDGAIFALRGPSGRGR